MITTYTNIMMIMIIMIIMIIIVITIMVDNDINGNRKQLPEAGVRAPPHAGAAADAPGAPEARAEHKHVNTFHQ